MHKFCPLFSKASKIHKMKPVLILSTAFLLTLSSAGQKKKLDVLIDEKTELITVTQLLFGYPLVVKLDINYKKNLNR